MMFGETQCFWKEEAQELVFNILLIIIKINKKPAIMLPG